MDPGLQTKLLRVLEEKAFERVGGNKTIHSDVRIIAATNKNLMQQVENGLFREDLYYRINVLPIRLPSLRERKDSLVPLAHLLLNKCCKSMRREIHGFSASVVRRIREYDWPGNIRQLSNTIERAVILEDDSIIHSASLSLPDIVKRTDRRSTGESLSPSPESGDAASPGSLADQERKMILAVLEECLWVQKNAAAKLGISPRSLNYKINKLDIKHPHWRRNS
jgi:DNA-binding NtrC family response regulator